VSVNHATQICGARIVEFYRIKDGWNAYHVITEDGLTWRLDMPTVPGREPSVELLLQVEQMQ
jgi:hypothetical protein